MLNEPARRRRRRRGGIFGGERGTFSVEALAPAMGGGVLAGLVQGFAVPWVTQAVGLAPAGLLYRVVQGGVALGGAWALDQVRVLPRGWTQAMAGYGLAFAALGLIQDLQRGGIGALMPTTAAPAATPPAFSGSSGMGYYRALPVGSSYGGERSGLAGYYAALPR